MQNNITRLFSGSKGLSEFYSGYVDYLGKCLNTLDLPRLESVVEAFMKAREDGKTIYFAGNGGSAATASHFCQDLAEVGRKANCDGFRTHSLSDNVAFITAAGNDYGYDAIFTTQMKYVFNSGDVLVVISASGNSPNVVAAARFAHEKGGTVIALVGFDGGKLGAIADHALKISTPKGEYGPVEDAHLIFDHAITNYLMMKLKS